MKVYKDLRGVRHASKSEYVFYQNSQMSRIWLLPIEVESALHMVLLVLYDDEIYKSCKQLRLASGVGNWLSTQFKINDLRETNYILSI